MPSTRFYRAAQDSVNSGIFMNSGRFFRKSYRKTGRTVKRITQKRRKKVFSSSRPPEQIMRFRRGNDLRTGSRTWQQRISPGVLKAVFYSRGYGMILQAGSGMASPENCQFLISLSFPVMNIPGHQLQSGPERRGSGNGENGIGTAAFPAWSQVCFFSLLSDGSFP